MSKGNLLDNSGIVAHDEPTKTDKCIVCYAEAVASHTSFPGESLALQLCDEECDWSQSHSNLARLDEDESQILHGLSPFETCLS